MSNSDQFEDRSWVRDAHLAGTGIAPLLPCRTIEDNLLINVDGSFGIGWRCQFPYLATLSDDRREDTFAKLRSAFKMLGAVYDVQVIFDDDQRCDDFLSNLNQGRKPEGLLGDYATEQVEKIQSRFGHGLLRWMSGYVCLIRKNPFPPAHFRQRKAEDEKTAAKEKQNGKPSLAGRLGAGLRNVLRNFSSSALDVTYTEGEWNRIKEEFFGFADSFHTELDNAGLKPIPLDPDGVLELLYRFWNPQGFDAGGCPRKYNPTEDLPLTDYFLTGGPHWDRDSGYFTLDGMAHLIATVTTPPSPLRFAQFENFLLRGGIRGVRHIITVRHGDVRAREKLVRDRLPELEAAARKNPMFEPALADAKREALELGKGDEKAWLVQQVFVLRGKTREEVNRTWLELRKFAERSEGMLLEQEADAVIDYLIASQPLWTRDKDVYRMLPFNTGQLVTQLSVVGQPTFFQQDNGQSARVGAVFETTSGTLLNCFLHDDTRFSNANSMVVGQAGKGKSVLINELIGQYRSRVPCRFVIIDAGVDAKRGGSYRKTCEALRGNYLDMDLTTKGRVSNPFYTEENHFPDPDEMDAMVRAAERFVVKEGQQGLDSEDLSLIERTLLQLFRNAQGRKEVTLSDFRKLLQDSDARGEALAMRLARWTGDGSFANLHDGPNQLDLSNWLTVFDLTKIKENKTVCPLAFANIFATVSQLASRYPNEYKFVIFDECAEFLKDPVVAAYIERCYRQMRKAGVAVIGVSQSLEEFISTASKTGFINNTTHLFLFANDPCVAQMLKDAFGLNETELEILTSLQSIPGEFSQVLLSQKLGNGQRISNVVVTRPTPLGLAMATTNPRDGDAFAELRRTGLSYDDAVREFARRYPNGVSRAAPQDFPPSSTSSAA